MEVLIIYDLVSLMSSFTNRALTEGLFYFLSFLENRWNYLLLCSSRDQSSHNQACVCVCWRWRGTPRPLCIVVTVAIWWANNKSDAASLGLSPQAIFGALSSHYASITPTFPRAVTSSYTHLTWVIVLKIPFGILNYPGSRLYLRQIKTQGLAKSAWRHVKRHCRL